MFKPRGFAQWLSALFAVSLTAQVVLAQEQAQSVSRDDGRVLAERLTELGQPTAAREIALALLQADPQDALALVALARAEIVLRRPEAAQQAATRALRAAQTSFEKFMAHLVVAEIFAQTKQFTRSQIWLRRAQNFASSSAEQQLLADAYRSVRDLNPLAMSLSFGLSPSSNVNAGNSNRAIQLAYLPGILGEIEWLVPAEQRPLSGIEFSLQTDLRYRISETDRSRTSLEFGVYGRTFLMSDNARASAPDVTGESLSYGQVSAGVLHQWVGAQSDQPISASLTYTHAWAGGAPYRQQLNATLGTRYVLENEDELSISGGIGWTDRFAASDDVLTYSLRGRWSRELANDHVANVTGGLSVATSDATDQAYTDASLSFGYDFGEIGAGVDLSATWTEQFRVYETSVFDPAGREDVSRSLRVEVGFQKIEFYGFEPVVNLTARRTDSSVPRFDTEGVQIGFNLRSSF